MATVTRLDPAPRAHVAPLVEPFGRVAAVDVRVESSCTPGMTAAVSNAERK